MSDIAFVSIPIQQQQWMEVEVKAPKRTGLFSALQGRKPEKKKEQQLQSQIQWHTFFGAEVPHLTDFLSIYRASDGPERRDAILRDALAHQQHFLTRMTHLAGHGRTMELRYLFQPAQQKVEVTFICKAVGSSEQESRSVADNFWQHFWTQFPRQIYGLTPITNPKKLEVYLNFQPHYISEFRRHERVASLGQNSFGYVVYPIQGSLKTLNNLWRILFEQSAPYLVSICLRPTQLTSPEKELIQKIITICRALESHRTQFSLSAREIGHIYTHYWYQLRRPFLFRISLGSSHPILPAIPAELSAVLAHPFQINENEGPFIPNETGHFVWPANEEDYVLAQTNLRYLEFTNWGGSDITPPLPRMPQLIGPTAAGSGFHIPIPPADGLPGIESRPLVMVNEGYHTIIGDRNIIGDIHIHGPVEGSIVIGGDLVRLAP